jgi:hypothetical protein
MNKTVSQDEAIAPEQVGIISRLMANLSDQLNYHTRLKKLR